MKKLVQINVVCNGSTGKIMCDIAKKANDNGTETYCFYGRGLPNKDVNCIKIGNKFSTLFHVFLARLGFNGHGSYFATKKLVNDLKRIEPDIIHLHNIHGYYINLRLLFNYLKKDYKGKVIWTLHDCWAFTGHCSYFVIANCDKWKKECHHCPQLDSYPKAIFDTTKREYKLKKELFSDVNNLILITPSNWLKKIVSASFLNQYEVKTVYNGIDKTIFYRRESSSNIFDKYPNLKDKKIILGVANKWEERKGLKYFLNLNKYLSSDYKIVLIGLNEQQISELPDSILGIKRTDSIDELADFYSSSYVFYNPSFEETFSLVTAEAMSCGLPVIVFDSSAPKELISKNDYLVKNALFKSIDEVNNEVLEYIKDCKKTNLEEDKFSKEEMIKNYLKLYE